MKIKQYEAKTPGGRKILAEACGVSATNVYQWSRGIRPVPVEHCAAIEAATLGAITRQELRPDDWAYIWPELAVANESS